MNITALVSGGAEPSAPALATAESRPSERELMLLVYRQMRLFAGPSQDLDDLAQAALEQVLLARFEGRSKFSTFCHSICYRVWLNHLRFRYRFQRIFSWSRSDTPLEQVDSQTAESKAEDEERMHRLYRALAQVSPKRRAVLLLHDIQEEGIASVAQIVGTSEATARTRLRDGRKQLCALLHEDPYFSAPGGPDHEL